MNFQDLHEQLRLELVRRIDAGALSGTKLARQTGFRQAHISNFLNRKRSLSLEGLDRMLAAQDIAIENMLSIDLAAATQPASPVVSGLAIAKHSLPPDRSGISSPAEEAPGATEDVPVISPSSAMADAQIQANGIIETIQISTSRLAGQHPRSASRMSGWRRFVAVRADAQQAAAMEPMLAAGSVAVIDRHYNSLAPYRSPQPNLYAVRCGAALQLRFVEFDEGHLILRPVSVAWPTQLLRLGSGETPADYLVGRICIIFHEL